MLSPSLPQLAHTDISPLLALLMFCNFWMMYRLCKSCLYQTNYITTARLFIRILYNYSIDTIYLLHWFRWISGSAASVTGVFCTAEAPAPSKRLFFLYMFRNSKTFGCTCCSECPGRAHSSSPCKPAHSNIEIDLHALRFFLICAPQWVHKPRVSYVFEVSRLFGRFPEALPQVLQRRSHRCTQGLQVKLQKPAALFGLSSGNQFQVGYVGGGSLQNSSPPLDATFGAKLPSPVGLLLRAALLLLPFLRGGAGRCAGGGRLY